MLADKWDKNTPLTLLFDELGATPHEQDHVLKSRRPDGNDEPAAVGELGLERLRNCRRSRGHEDPVVRCPVGIPVRAVSDHDADVRNRRARRAWRARGRQASDDARSSPPTAPVWREWRPDSPIRFRPRARDRSGQVRARRSSIPPCKAARSSGLRRSAAAGRRTHREQPLPARTGAAAPLASPRARAHRSRRGWRSAWPPSVPVRQEDPSTSAYNPSRCRSPSNLFRKTSAHSQSGRTYRQRLGCVP